MALNSILFLVFFLPVFLAVFYAVSQKYRFLVLLAGSLFFYYYSSLFNLVLIVLLGFINYLIGLFVKKGKIVLFVSVIMNLATLAFFKYWDFFAFPLGISFYTFNNISYLVDVYRHKCEAERNPLFYLTYVTMFPTVSMGPLSRYQTIKECLISAGAQKEDFHIGLRRFVWGLIKKCLLADNLGLLYGNLKASDDKSVLLLVTMIIVFGIQLYIDFSSYSDMAIGLGKMIGISYDENFDYPYLSSSVSDFWRRWHMALNRFFMSYVYIPLGGNRVGFARQIINIMIVWVLTGIWHGSSLNFLAWGVYYGVILVLEKHLWAGLLKKMPEFIKHLYVLIIVFIGYIFFSVNSMAEVSRYFSSLFSSPLVSHSILFYLQENAVLLLAGLLTCLKVPAVFEKLLKNEALSLIRDLIIVLLFILSIAYILAGNYLPFLYGAF